MPQSGTPGHTTASSGCTRAVLPRNEVWPRVKLKNGLHLAYCTNIHRGESWQETFDSLRNYTLQVRAKVAPREPYAIGLRLSNQAARELSEPSTLLSFRKWLDENDCYVFTINGFPYGNFHGTRVKEQVYVPDWTTPERLDYTKVLFDLLAQLVPVGIEGSVSTVPGGFKPEITTTEQRRQFRSNLWRCVEHIARLSESSGRKLHLGLEPEPMCLLETTEEVVQFFDELRQDRTNDSLLSEYLGINYDTCHLAIQFEEPRRAIGLLRKHGIKLSKIHVSSALTMRPTQEARAALAGFADEIYLHQAVVRYPDGRLRRYLDIDQVLECERDKEISHENSPEIGRAHV